MFEDRLLEIGLTKKEVKVYLELLRIGSQAVSVLAKRMDYPRTTTYSTLKALQKKGLVSYFYNENMKYFSANDPNCLVGLVDMRRQSFEYQKDKLLAEIPRLRSISAVCDFRQPVVSFYEGKRGVKYVMDDVINCNSKVYSYVCLHKWRRVLIDKYLAEFRDYRLIEKNTEIKIIAPNDKVLRGFFDEYKKLGDNLVEVLYLDSDMASSLLENQMNIYDNKVGIACLDPGEEYGVLIESKHVADMQRRIFEMVWRGCEDELRSGKDD
jgi:HTH-type transcriptional regulator, sugar sensing transcriptional regulator